MKMIAAGGFRDITRIASSSPIMWEQICVENNQNISNVLDDYIRMLIQIRCSIDNKEADNIFDMFASSKDYRDSIDIVDNSLIPRSYVLYIDVADEAGAIATIATILAQPKPYDRIGELPELIQKVKTAYSGLLDLKKDEVAENIRQCMQDVHQLATEARDAGVLLRQITLSASVRRRRTHLLSPSWTL